ncbi:MAG: hypothetical protein WCA36_02170 [Pseudolabrys sp.]|jgi:uncharacterized membrane protein YkoI
MPVLRRLFALLLLGFLAMGATSAVAAGHPGRACLTKAEQRAAVASHRAISLGRAIKSAHRHGHHGEALRARLCHRGGRLVYVLTLLPRNGKVRRVTVDAGNGRVISGR